MLDGNWINEHVSSILFVIYCRYLCEFTFYKSLQMDPSRTIFVHVPPLGKPYSAEEISSGLLDVIQCALMQINCNSTNLNNVNK